MAVFERDQVGTLVSRLAESPHFIIALFGPRQTGKTTIVRQALQRIEQPSRYLAVDEPDSASLEISSTPAGATLRRSQERGTEWLVLNWERARREAERSPKGSVLVLDEIQKIPQWSETVKGLWDADRAEDRPLHVVILGSAPLLMQSGLTESLAGRFEPIRVTHWSFPEMATALTSTWTPTSSSADIRARLSEFRASRGGATTSCARSSSRTSSADVLAMTRVDKPALLKRLFALGASCSGQILSYTKMLGQLQDAGNTTTLARYIDLLESAGLLAGLSKICQPAASTGIEPEAHGAEHGADDSRCGVRVRGGAG